MTKKQAYEDYLKWIEPTIDPKRIKMGLNPLLESELKKCFEILYKAGFYDSN